MDDYGYATLNGAVLPGSNVPAGLNPTTGDAGYEHWTTFSANSGFVNGVNTLDFFVTNEYHGLSFDPTGIRVEFLSSNVAAVPEPATWAIMLAGLGILGGARRRLRTSD